MVCWINQYTSVITLTFSMLVTASTIVYAFLTRKLVSETIIMRRIQTDPNIQINIIYDEIHPFLTNFIIENVGNSVAKNVSFSVISEPKINKNKELREYGFIKNGLVSLSPHTKLKTLYLNTVNEGIEIADKEIIIEVKYEDLRKRKYFEKFIFDLSYIGDIKIAQTDPLYNINNTLKEMNNKLEKRI